MHFLRNRLGLTGTKGACGRGECGACTVLVGDNAVMSCITLALEVDDDVTTVEGLADSASDVGEAFADNFGFQCGYCTSGQVVRAEALLRKRLALSRADIVAAMSSNICRCTGYTQIFDAVEQVAAIRGLASDRRHDHEHERDGDVVHR